MPNKRIQPKDFRYTLISESETLVLTHHPIGWNEYGMEWARKRDDRGYGNKMVTDLRFVKEGANFLRRIFAEGESMAKAKLLVERCNRSTYQYYTAFEADFNFSQYNDYRHRDANYVSVQLLEVNALSDMEGNQKAVYELDMPDTVTVQQTANAINTATWTREDKKGEEPYFSDGYAISIGSNDITSDRITVKTQDDSFIDEGFTLRDWLLRIDAGNSIIPTPKIVLKYKISDISIAQNDTNNRGIILYSYYTLPPDPETMLGLSYLFTLTLTSADNGKTIEGTIPLDAFPEPIGADKNWFLGMRVSLNLPVDNTMIMNVDLRLDMSVLAEPLVQPFSFPAIRLFDLGRELLARIKPGYTFSSSLLENDSILSTTFAASGDAIRNIEGAKLKTSWRDFKESINRIHPTCLQVDYANMVVRLEDIGQAYRKDVEILDLGKVERLDLEPYLEEAYSLINIGISDPDYSMVNGRFEFNNEHQYKTAITVTSSEGDFISKLRTDSFGVTAARYEAEKSETKDGKSDNNIFLIHCHAKENPTPYVGHEIIGDETQLQRTGIFNVGLTPSRCLRRQARLLLTALRKQSHTLSWQTSSKTSATLVSRFQDPITGEWDSVAEKDDVTLEGEPLFIAKKAKFTAIIPKNLPELMHANIGGYLSFTWKGNRYKGFPMDVQQRPVHNSPQEIYVLLHPETDIA
jgi:hypothetical protein